MSAKLKWTEPFHGLTHYGEIRDRYRVSVQHLSSIGRAELFKWFPGCGFSPETAVFQNLSEAKRAGEEWFHQMTGRTA